MQDGRWDRLGMFSAKQFMQLCPFSTAESYFLILFSDTEINKGVRRMRAYFSAGDYLPSHPTFIAHQFSSVWFRHTYVSCCP